MMSKCSTLLASLQYRASAHSGTADQTAFTYLRDGEQIDDSVTFLELNRRARSVAAYIQTLANPGDRVLLVYPPSLDYITAFFGCVYARVIAVPALPPTNARTIPRLRVIVESARPSLALASAEIEARVKECQTDRHGDALSRLFWLTTDTVEDASPLWKPADVQPSDIAFLQYTSGSTDSPKGVMVSHANVLANVHAITTSFPLAPHDSIVSWLPPHHDMGLIGKILFPVHAGYHSVQLPPAAFLKRPYRWLKLISDYRARLTAAPNFAYELCVDKISAEEKQSLDLSSLEFALNGAEPVRSSTLRRFARAFSVCGFRPEATTPVYGLAESTLLVAGSTRRVKTRLPKRLALSKTALALDRVRMPDRKSDSMEIVSVGAPPADHEVIIVDPASFIEQAEDAIGEVWVRGPSVAQGYWERPEESERAFAGKVPGRDDVYLRTGDLGFIHHDQLYIAGRIKELMIFNGRNIYPQDIEATVERLDPAFRSGGCAAFALEDDGSAQLVIVQELESRQEPRPEKLADTIRAEIAEQHEVVDIAAILLVKAGQIPRTTSGKIQRGRCKSLFLKNEWAPLWSWKNTRADGQTPSRRGDSAHVRPSDQAPIGKIEIAMAALWRDVLGLERVGRHDHFFDLGGHSLAATQLASRARQTFGVDISLRDLFAHPTVEALSKVVSHADAAPVLDILLADRTQPLPLSKAQQRLWFLDRLDPDASAAYHVPAALRLAGALNRNALRSALDRIVARHEALRSTFVNAGGKPFQVIHPADIGFAMIEHDLRSMSKRNQHDAVTRLARAELDRSFDMASGPLVRGQLLRLADNEHILLLTQHHIVCDGWSINLFLQEMTALYTAFIQDRPDPLPPLPLQYVDYVVCQQHWLQGEALRTQIDFWRNHLASAPALLELPTDRPRPAQQDYSGANIEVQLGEPVSEQLKQLSRRHGVTLYMTLLASWAVLLGRLSQQQTVVIGSAMAGRKCTQIEPLIGFFVNTLALPVHVPDELTVGELLQRTKQDVLTAQQYQDLPFEQVVDIVQPPRSLAHAPLFQVMFDWYNTPRAQLQMPGLELSLIETAASTTQFDLSLSLRETEAGIGGMLNYATALFDEQTARRYLGYWRRLLESMVSDESCRLARLTLLTPAERDQVLVQWNARRVVYPHERCVHELFESQAARAPDAIAVVCEGQRLSYRELNAQANRLAHHLRTLGVVADSRVAVCVERGAQMAIALLATLKSGGCYVPLDAAYPSERIAYMLGDSDPVVVLTVGAARTIVADFVPQSTPVLDLQADAARWSDQSEENLSAASIELGAERLAYIIYTSGSTGRPKGVMVEHRGLVNYTLEAIRWFELHGGDTVLQQNSLNFDLSIEETLPALLAGATLAPSKQLFGSRDEHAQSASERVRPSVVHLTAAHWHSLVGEWMDAGATKPEVLQGVRLINVTGDAVSLQKLRQWETLKPASTRLINTYGPTEATVSCSAAYLHYEKQAGRASIGKPFANTPIYILDEQLQPVPSGVSGELYIGGVQVARGYLNRPELTRERFLADPFSTDPQARMYKTGDLGRWRADGTLEYLGRNDHQVKIRGFRIELGEIETQLSTCRGVREAVVIAREDTPGDKRLVAYIVPEEIAAAGLDASTGGADTPNAPHDRSVSITELRAKLASALPEYMVPAAYVTLDALPLTPNGKLDRQALPSPQQDAYVKRTYEEPVGEIEVAIATLWQDLLHIERVGRHDHFFELGGHSLLAVQLVSRLRQLLGVDIALRDLFATPTLCDLAPRLAQATPLVLPPIRPADRTRPLPLSWAQQRLWFLAQLDPAASAAYHMPAAFRLQGALNHKALQDTLDLILARHEILRTRFVRTVDNEPVQVIDPPHRFDLRQHDLRPLPEPEQQAALARLSEATFHHPFDFSTGALIRAQLLQLADQEHILLFCQHHIVSDGWSIGLLVREMTTLYGAFIQGQPDPLPPLAIQYADFALWQRQGLQSAAQIEFWRTHLAGAPALLELPTDHPRPAAQSYVGAYLPIVLPAELSAALRTLSQQHGATLFMTLLAGWASLLARLSGHSDLVIGTPVAGRLRTEVEALIGFFVNTLALRIPLDDDPTVTQLLGRIKATTLAAYAHQEVPFEQVVEALQPVRTLSHSPLFQVLLSLDNTPLSGTLSLPGLSLTPLPSLRPTTYFDLSLSLTDTGTLITGELQYASDLFEQATIERLAGHLQTLLSAMANDASQRISALPLLSPAERQQLLVDWNGTPATFSSHLLIHQVFEARAAAHPDATAVVYEDQSLSYGELNAKANQVAHYLVSLGIRPDQPVALYVERSLEMVIGLLGILKAGGAYVPLDPNHPQERLGRMLADCAPLTVLTQVALKGHLSSVPVVALDHCAAFIDRPNHNPDSFALGLTPSHLAYVIYTSGSTGSAKGVMVEHRSAVNFWQVMCDSTHRPCPARARIGLNAPFFFDMSLKGLLQLLSGHCLFIIPQQVRADGAALLSFLQQNRIDAFDCTPSQLNLLLQAGLLGCRYQPESVLVGGEPIDTPTWRQLSGASAHFFNMYGPTECTVDASIGLINGSTGQPHIGRPVANTKLYLLDAHQQPVPIGVSGEIHIGGVQVARGYLNRPELTRERFLPDPFSTDPQARMYKTGDLGRWRADGTLEYLGRNDHQVKIRGFRIELGEIEAQLSVCRGVREVVVIAREDAPGDKRLVAYIVPEGRAAAGLDASVAGVDVPSAPRDRARPSITELRAQLASALPEYMVPAAYVILDALPLTPNGKLDRRALPSPEADAYSTRTYEAPIGEIETIIADLWCELLQVERIGRHADFFEIGGHSLLAIKLTVRMQNAFNLNIPIAKVFQHSTIRSLAMAVADMQLSHFDSDDIARAAAKFEQLSERELQQLLEVD